jgi:hypothetical protein
MAQRGHEEFLLRSRDVTLVNGWVFRLASLATCAGVCVNYWGARVNQIEVVLSGGWAFRSRIVILGLS